MLRKSSVVEIPRLVAIETTSRCNARCAFCPNSALSRGKQDMSDDLFEKIVDDCRRFPLAAVEPFLNGEPFVDPKILARLELLRRRLPKARLRVYSNGAALTPRRADELVGLGIDHLFISLNTVVPEKYHAVMGLKFERTLANLHYLADPRRRSKIARRITVRMTRTADTPLHEQKAFLRLCGRLGVTPFIVALFNYKGYVDSTLPVPAYPCEHITRLDILASGVVTLCCMDQEGEFAWGDVRRESVLDAHNSPVARRYRALLRTGRRAEIAPCNVCNVFWPSLSDMPLADTARFALQAARYWVERRPTGLYAPPPAPERSC